MSTDLKGTPLGKKVESLLKQLAAGNEGDATLEELTLDPNTGVATGKVRLKHQHDYGGVQLGPKYMNATIKYDFTTGDYSGDIELGKVELKAAGVTIIDETIKIDIDKVKKLMEGDLSVALELIPNPGGLVKRSIKTDYESIRDSYYQQHGGKKNVYFASERFVRWAGPDTAGKWVLEAVASGGATAFASAMKEATKEAGKELKLFQQWLEEKGQGEAQDVALMMLTGQKVDWPDIALKWQTVKYATEVSVGGRKVGGEILPLRHAAFVFIWKGVSGSQATTEPGNIGNLAVSEVENPDEDPRPGQNGTQTGNPAINPLPIGGDGGVANPPPIGG